MSGATFFLQECPTCGRRLQIRIEHLGRCVQCPHCVGRFQASDPSGARLMSDSAILERANELLASADAQRQRAVH